MLGKRPVHPAGRPRSCVQDEIRPLTRRQLQERLGLGLLPAKEVAVLDVYAIVVVRKAVAGGNEKSGRRRRTGSLLEWLLRWGPRLHDSCVRQVARFAKSLLGAYESEIS